MWTYATGVCAAGTVVENNDSYLTTAVYTDCAGNFNGSGPCAAAEDGGAGTKAGGSPSAPYRIIGNRIWGQRPTDTALCCDGGGTGGMALTLDGNASAPVDYVLLQNNIISDATSGAGWFAYDHTTSNVSVAGNVIYNIKRHGNDAGAGIILEGTVESSEIYLNTFVDIAGADEEWGSFGGNSNLDVRCNVAIDAPQATGLGGGSSEIDHSVYYGTPASGEVDWVSKSLNLRANSTAYAANDVMRLATSAAACIAATDPECYLYKVTDSGTSASSQPTPCATLGCTFADGGVTWQAIRGPYCFYRKLRTTPEQVCIPYAVPHESAPEYGFCRSDNMGGVPLGSRPGIGVNDEVAPW